MTEVELRGVTHSYRSTETVRDINFTARSGEFLTLIGPSGSGKSTILQMIAGLLQPDDGDILFNRKIAPKRLGKTGYMPQSDTLLPWRTVLSNVLLGSEIQRTSRAAAKARALELLPLFGLQGYKKAYPAQLSGGMRQRAAFLRTFLIDSDIILLDEPFGALDALTRLEMQRWLLNIWQHFGYTIVFVTHDIREAVLLSDRVIVLSTRPGEIVATVPIEIEHQQRLATYSPDMVTIEQHLLALLTDHAV